MEDIIEEKKSGGLIDFLKKLFKKEPDKTSAASNEKEKQPAGKNSVTPDQSKGNKTHTEQGKAESSVQNGEGNSPAEETEPSVANDDTQELVEEAAAPVQNNDTETSVEETADSVQDSEEELTVSENNQTMKETEGKKNEELKKLNRLELIEIIYKLKRSEEFLQEENEELRNSLDEKVLCMNKAGSIAEAVVGLNRIFETAQKTADEYIESIQRSYAEENGINLQAEVDSMIQDAKDKAEKIVSEAQESTKAEREAILTQAQQKADEILLSARQEAEKESEEILSKAKKDADEYLDAVMESAESKAAQESNAMLEQARQDVERLKAEFYEEVRATLRQYPELAKRMRG